MLNGAIAEELALACNILAMEGHSDISLGHVTARVPAENRIYIKPAALGLEEIRPQDVIAIDYEGIKVEGEGRCHRETPIHTEIYKARPDVNCVIHTHPLYATALGAGRQRLLPVSHEGALFAGGLPRFVETSELILTPEQGRAVARELGQAPAALLKNHGVVVVGPGIRKATLLAVFLEKAARVQLLAGLFGQPEYSPLEEAHRKVGQAYPPESDDNYWEYFVRKLDRLELRRR